MLVQAIFNWKINIPQLKKPIFISTSDIIGEIKSSSKVKYWIWYSYYFNEFTKVTYNTVLQICHIYFASYLKVYRHLKSGGVIMKTVIILRIPLSCSHDYATGPITTKLIHSIPSQILILSSYLSSELQSGPMRHPKLWKPKRRRSQKLFKYQRCIILFLQLARVCGCKQ